MERGKVDLRTCEPGDTLISALGAKLKYVGQTDKYSFYDHVVEYLEMDGKPCKDMGTGTRTHDGYVMRMNRQPDIDHDIVEIIKKKK
jgi:hypothetical protein